MHLLPQDVVVTLKLVTQGAHQTYATLGRELAMSPSQVFRSVERAQAAGLLSPLPLPSLPGRTGPASSPNRGNLKEFLIHGVRYAFPVERGSLVRGIPTGHAAPPLNRHFADSGEPPPVWPCPQGDSRGTAFSPLYRNAVDASLRDPRLYELLALVDAIRGGRARERALAVRELTSRIDSL